MLPSICLASFSRSAAALAVLCATLLPSSLALAQPAPGCSQEVLDALAGVGGWAASACTAPQPPTSVPSADDAQPILTFNHGVHHLSTSSALVGKSVDLYVRERVAGQTLAATSSTPAPVVLFLHGASLGSTGAFDLPSQDYSWMAFLARNGFDAFSLDLTGYGYSTRPSQMNDPCNLSADLQALLPVGTLPASCPAAFATRLTTQQSVLDDLDTAVDYIRSLRGVDRVGLVGWSLGGTWVSDYAVQHPDKVARIVLLAPAYDRDHAGLSAPIAPDAGAPVPLLGRATLAANWDRQVQCAGQFDPGIRDAIWTEGLAADGVAWAADMRRVPSAPVFRWNQAIATRVQVPTLLVSGEFDQMSQFTVPDAIRAAYADLGASHKLFLDLACSSHFALWESNHLALFHASLEWLRDGSVNGNSQGTVRRDFGYDRRQRSWPISKRPGRRRNPLQWRETCLQWESAHQSDHRC